MKMKKSVSVLILAVFLFIPLQCSKISSIFSDRPSLSKKIVGIWEGEFSLQKDRCREIFTFLEDGTFTFSQSILHPGVGGSDGQNDATFEVSGSYSVENDLVMFSDVIVRNVWFVKKTMVSELSMAFSSLTVRIENSDKTMVIADASVMTPKETDGEAEQVKRPDDIWGTFSTKSLEIHHYPFHEQLCQRQRTTTYSFSKESRNVTVTIYSQNVPGKCGDEYQKWVYSVNYTPQLLQLISPKGVVKHYKVTIQESGRMVWVPIGPPLKTYLKRPAV